MPTPLATSAHLYRTLKDRLLQDMPELADDEECLLDTLEGLTNTKEQIASLLRSALNEEALAKGLGDYLQKLTDRKSALDARAKKKRSIALHYMADLGMKNITEPDMTVTRKATPPSVIVSSEESIPDLYVRIKREPDKAAIRAALSLGKDVPGCSLSNGGETLQIKI